MRDDHVKRPTGQGLAALAAGSRLSESRHGPAHYGGKKIGRGKLLLKLLSLLTQQLHVPHTQEFLHLLLLRSELRRGDCVCPGLRALRRLHGRLRRLRGLHGRLHGARSWREQIQASKEIDRCLRDLAKITAHRKQFVVARI